MKNVFRNSFLLILFIIIQLQYGFIKVCYNRVIYIGACKGVLKCPKAIQVKSIENCRASRRL